MNRREFLKGLLAAGIVTICPIPAVLPKPELAGIVTAGPGPSIASQLWARQLGKSLAQDLHMLQILKEKPNARIARVSSKGTELVSSKEEVLSRIRHGYGEDVYKFALDKSNTPLD